MGDLLSPVEAVRIGQSVLRDRGNGRPHKGVDLFAAAGSPVFAPVGGTVIRVEDGRFDTVGSDRWRAGLWVDIIGDDMNVHRFLHLGRAQVRAGQRVEPGTGIGIVSAAGSSGVGPDTDPHLHYEIRDADYDPQRPKWPGKSLRKKGDYGLPIDPLTKLRQSKATPNHSVTARAPGPGPELLATFAPAASERRIPGVVKVIGVAVFAWGGLRLWQRRKET